MLESSHSVVDALEWIFSFSMASLDGESYESFR